MQPSSLIFIAVVVIWVAFLVQHWVARRESVATARTVDRYSEAMRVLERRTVPGSAQSVARETVAPTPLVARRPAPAVPQSGLAEPFADEPTRRPLRMPAGLGLRMPRRAARTRRPGVIGRRVRGLTLLACLIALPTTIILSALDLLPVWSVVVASVALVFSVVALRYAAVRDRTRRRTDVSRARTAARPAATRPAVRPARTGPSVRDVARATTGEVPTSAGPAAAPVTEPARSAAATAVAGRAEVAPAAPQPEVTPEQERRTAYRMGRTADGTWVPIPVPPPTYTLKAKAERPQPAPAEVTPTPQPVQRADVEPERERRVVG